jgi:hypothetical protein
VSTGFRHFRAWSRLPLSLGCGVATLWGMMSAFGSPLRPPVCSHLCMWCLLNGNAGSHAPRKGWMPRAGLDCIHDEEMGHTWNGPPGLMARRQLL